MLHWPLNCVLALQIVIFAQRFFKQNGPNPASFVYFRPFHNTMTNTVHNLTNKYIDGVLGTRTWGGRVVGADESTELWRHPRDFYNDMFLPSLTDRKLQQNLMIPGSLRVCA